MESKDDGEATEDAKAAETVVKKRDFFLLACREQLCPQIKYKERMLLLSDGDGKPTLFISKNFEEQVKISSRIRYSCR